MVWFFGIIYGGMLGICVEYETEIIKIHMGKFSEEWDYLAFHQQNLWGYKILPWYEYVIFTQIFEHILPHELKAEKI